jgi:hypothetical protein
MAAFASPVTVDVKTYAISNDREVTALRAGVQ